MADPKPKKRVLKQESIRTLSDKAKNQPKKQTKRRGLFRTIFKPIAYVLRPIRWLGSKIVPRYIKNSFAELKLVTWPDRKQSRQLTTAVLIFAIIMGASVSLVDYGLDKLFKKVILKQ